MPEGWGKDDVQVQQPRGWGTEDTQVGAAPEKPTATWGETAKDVGRSIVSGVEKGFTGLAGLPGDIAGLFPESWRDKEAKLPTSAETQKAAEKYTGKFYEPQTTAGKYAHTVGEFAPAVVGSPAGLAARALRYE